MSLEQLKSPRLYRRLEMKLSVFYVKSFADLFRVLRHSLPGVPRGGSAYNAFRIDREDQFRVQQTRRLSDGRGLGAQVGNKPAFVFNKLSQPDCDRKGILRFLSSSMRSQLQLETEISLIWQKSECVNFYGNQFLQKSRISAD